MGRLLLSVAVFGAGFFARPLGGALITLCTLGTLGLALTPSYERIGLAAPVIVVLCRLVQGLALGGEVGPSSTVLIEAALPGRRGLYASRQLASQGAAGLVAGTFGLVLTHLLTPAEMLAWGWRLPFLVGLLLVPLAVYLRQAMPEALHDAPAQPTNPGIRGLTCKRGLIGLALLVLIGGTVSTCVANVMTPYAITTLKMSPPVAMGTTVVVGLSSLVFSLPGGWLCDRAGRRPTMSWHRVAGVSVVTALALLAMPESRGHALED